jgi:hypothetical protein
MPYDAQSQHRRWRRSRPASLAHLCLVEAAQLNAQVASRHEGRGDIRVAIAAVGRAQRRQALNEAVVGLRQLSHGVQCLAHGDPAGANLSGCIRVSSPRRARIIGACARTVDVLGPQLCCMSWRASCSSCMACGFAIRRAGRGVCADQREIARLAVDLAQPPRGLGPHQRCLGQPACGV